VQQRGRDGGGVEELLGQDERDRDAVGDEILARHPLLPPVRGRAEAQGPIDEIEVQAIRVPLEDGAQVGGEVGQGTGHSSPAVAKLTKRSPAMMT
jgi:hypothetical protein